MLDIMRKHASSWLIKVVLGAIIITFIFFFGYSSYRKGMRGGRVGGQGGLAAKVNGIPVSTSEFDFFFNRNFERLKEQFEGKEIPPFVRQMAESSTLQQLVGREVSLQQADELGIVVSDTELADAIRKGQAAQQGGEFDPIAYRHEFLPYFRNRFGMDYEQFVRQDLRLAVLQELFANVDKTPAVPAAESASKEAVWTFEVVTIDPKALVESKAIASEDEARALADRIAAADPKEWPKALKSAKLTSAKVGPIGISERTKLLGGNGKLEDYQAIFTLTGEPPVAARPFVAEGKINVIRLVERGERETKAGVPAPSGDFFQEWMAKLLAKAKVQNFMKKDEQQ